MNRDIFIVNTVDNLISIISNCKKKIYIYGSGKYGGQFASFLDDCSVNYNGFIVTKKEQRYFHNHEVYSLRDVENEIDVGDYIFLAMKEQYVNEVIENISDEFKGDIVKIEENVFWMIQYERLSRFLLNLHKNYPPSTEIEKEAIHKILVIRLDRLGDLVWTSAFIRELRRNFLNAKIDVLVGSNNVVAMEECPYVDEILEYTCSKEEEAGTLSFDETFRNAEIYVEKRLNNSKYDAVFVARGIYRDGFLIALFLAILCTDNVRIANWMEMSDKIPKHFKECMEMNFSFIAEHKRPSHEVEKMLSMLKVIGGGIEDDGTEVWFSKEKALTGINVDDVRIMKQDKQYLIAVGLTSKDKNRTWGWFNYKRLFESVSERFSVKFLLLGDENACDFADKCFIERCCINLTGKTNLHGLMYIISLCDIYIGVDTGLVHIAAALKKPVIEIRAQFPWGDDESVFAPKRSGAWGTNYTVIQPIKSASVECAKMGYCVNMNAHCINEISPQQVEKVINGYLLYYDFSNQTV